jgi:hypothetical protein
MAKSPHRFKIEQYSKQREDEKLIIRGKKIKLAGIQRKKKAEKRQGNASRAWKGIISNGGKDQPNSKVLEVSLEATEKREGLARIPIHTDNPRCRWAIRPALSFRGKLSQLAKKTSIRCTPLDNGRHPELCPYTHTMPCAELMRFSAPKHVSHCRDFQNVDAV